MTRSAFLLLLLITGTAFAQNVGIEQYREASEKRWAREMARFAERDQTEKHPDDAILFVGSSSIRMWKDKLHQNRDGYVRWSAAIKSHLDSVLD